MNQTPVTQTLHPIYQIVITGGPCSGKTTGLAQIVEYFSSRSWRVIVIPEQATKLISGGLHPKDLSGNEFQKLILESQLAEESLFLKAAKLYQSKGEKVLMLFDRGLMDGAAYMATSADFREMVASFGLSLAQICDERYHGVIHMQTAAVGALEFYTLANNAARMESPQLAAEIDSKTLDAWRRHPHHRLIDNGTNFEGKLFRLKQEIASIIGDPLPCERERKFLVQCLAELPITCVESRIIQHYLVPNADGQTRRVRARACDGETVYTYTEKAFVSAGVNIEKERNISQDMYAQLLEFQIPHLNPVLKTRHSFFWNGKFFEYDVFDAPVNECVLEIELSSADDTFELPPFLTVIREVTDDPNYSNRKIAERFS